MESNKSLPATSGKNDSNQIVQRRGDKNSMIKGRDRKKAGTSTTTRTKTMRARSKEKEANKIKIKRTDKEALLKVSPKVLTTVSMDATNHN